MPGLIFMCNGSHSRQFVWTHLDASSAMHLDSNFSTVEFLLAIICILVVINIYFSNLKPLVSHSTKRLIPSLLRLISHKVEYKFYSIDEDAYFIHEEESEKELYLM